MNKPINIFIDAHTFDGEFQGSRTYIKEIYNRFPDDADIQLYFAAQDPDNLKNEIRPRRNVHFVKLNSRSSIKRLAVELPLLIRKLNIDYAHFQYVAPPVKLCKYIVTTHDILFHDFPKEFSAKYKLSKHILFKYSAKNADILTTVSEYSKQSISKHFHIKSSDIHVVPNAVGDSFFLHYDTAFTKKYIKEKYDIEKFVLYVSRIEPRKNHIAVIQAFKNLQLFKKGYSLVFIGKESIVDKRLNDAVNTLTPDEMKKYHHLSGISEEDLISFYKASTLAVYPSKAEGFGIPPLESGALKTPTLCSNTSAMSDFTFFDDALFNPNDQEIFEEKIKKRLEDGIDMLKVNHISEKIKSSYSWQYSSDKLHQLIVQHVARN